MRLPDHRRQPAAAGHRDRGPAAERGEPQRHRRPFAETKEQIGGFYVVEAADLDEALALVREMPAPEASVEVRPVPFRPGS